jgi:hypothetical protein
MPSPPHEERSPDLLEQDEASGIEALPRRVSRYGEAKSQALDVAEYIRGQVEPSSIRRRPGVIDLPTLSGRLASCGDYLAFRHYYTVDQVRLHAASFCKKHLLCPLCAIRRGAKALQAYLPRYEVVRAARADLRPFLVTLTVKDGPDLAERFAHLHKSQRELWKRKQRGRGSCLAGVEAAVWSYEVKRGTGSGEWHPHLHMVALAVEQPDQAELSAEWRRITGDSFVVDVRPIDQADPASGFLEVFKYALKFSTMDPADTLAAFRILTGRRLVGSAGAFRGIEIPEELTDEPLEGLPFAELFFRYLAGRGYTLGPRRFVGRNGVIDPMTAVGSGRESRLAQRPA